MQCSTVLASLLPGLVAVACATSPATDGPLPVRNQHPAQLMLLDLESMAGAPLPAGDVRARTAIAYSSLFLAGGQAGNSVIMDGELLRASLTLQAGVTDQLSVAAELPFVHATGGFLDSFLIDYHDLFSLPDEDRERVPKNRFRVFATHEGQTAFQMQENGIEMADLPLAASWQLQQPARGVLGLQLRLGVELPTGNEQRGLGNGEVDYGLGLSAELPLSGCSVHAHVQHTFAGTPTMAAQANLEFADVTAAGAGVVVPLLDDLQGLVQLHWEDSTLRNIDLDEAERSQLLLWMGGRVRLDGRLFLELALGEDLQGHVSPDVTFWFSFAWLPGH